MGTRLQSAYQRPVVLTDVLRDSAAPREHAFSEHRANSTQPVTSFLFDRRPQDVHEVLRVRHHAERLVRAAVLELAHDELRRVDADRRQLAQRSRRARVTNAGSMLPVAIACSAVAIMIAIVALIACARIASCAAMASVITSGSGPSSRMEPREHERHARRHAGVHDAVA